MNEVVVTSNEPKRKHSVKVPQIYKEAAAVLQKYLDKEGRLKSLAYNGKYRDARRVYALVSSVITNYQTIYQILQYQGVFSEHSRLNACIAVILASEIIRNKGILKGESRPILTMNTYADKLIAEFDARSSENSSNKVSDSLPRYVRVNTLIKSVEELCTDLTDEGWTRVTYEEEATYDEYLDMISNIAEYTYLMDFHIKTLLVFPPGTSFYGSQLVNSGSIILQDKASCLPVFLSGLRKGANVIDACAAPGNKTSYVASIVGKRGSIVAIEKDPKRCDVMKTLLEQREIPFVKVINIDFTQIEPSEYEGCDLILIDPTCSASGMDVHADQVCRDRIHRLSGFQYEVLSHALSFPGVQSVIYSTCSTYERENEHVIERALRKYSSQFVLEPLKDHLSGWKHFGSDKYSCGSSCIRTQMGIDRCQGFFVAKFTRMENGDCGENISVPEDIKKEQISDEIFNDLYIEDCESRKKEKRKHRKDADEFSENVDVNGCTGSVINEEGSDIGGETCLDVSSHSKKNKSKNNSDEDVEICEPKKKHKKKHKEIVDDLSSEKGDLVSNNADIELNTDVGNEGLERSSSKKKKNKKKRHSSDTEDDGESKKKHKRKHKKSSRSGDLTDNDEENVESTCHVDSTKEQESREVEISSSKKKKKKRKKSMDEDVEGCDSRKRIDNGETETLLSSTSLENDSKIYEEGSIDTCESLKKKKKKSKERD